MFMRRLMPIGMLIRAVSLGLIAHVYSQVSGRELSGGQTTIYNITENAFGQPAPVLSHPQIGLNSLSLHQRRHPLRRRFQWIQSLNSALMALH